MDCSSGFTAQGLVNLSGARIGENLSFLGAHLNSPDGSALRLRRLQASVLLLKPAEPPEGLVDLSYARVATLADEQASWPQRLRLRGFTYDTLDEPSTIRAAARLRWLQADEEGYSPEPYEQLAAAYRRAGRDQDARAIALAKQRARRRALANDNHHQHHRILARSLQGWSFLLDVLVGYGYRTWLAGVWLLGFVFVGWWVFDRAYPTYLVPLKPPGERPQFHAGLYALDLLLPIGDLNYHGAWIARGWARGVWLAWILAGWVVTTAVLAALTGILKRD
jgi:hypothetical protein